MPQTASQMIDAGEMLPQFRLPSADGRTVQFWDYKQRQALVLLILHGPDCAECGRLLEAYAARYAEVREQGAELLALLPASLEQVERLQAQVRLPFPLLADGTGETLARLGAWESARQAAQPTILVADRYGALYTRYTGASEGDLPAPDVALKDLEYVAMQCPE